MQLTTHLQHVMLSSWSLLVSYQQYRTELANLARITYSILKNHSGDPWLKAESTANALAISLEGTQVFSKICEEKEKQGANPLLRREFAKALARYIIDMDWPAIAMLTP